MASAQARILILCKTYPSPSARHCETSCVAGIDEFGQLVRLFPVPFRLINDDQKFKKWQWVKMRVAKATADHRPESHKVFVDTIEIDGAPIGAQNSWRERRQILDGLKVHDSFASLEWSRKVNGSTLGLLRPKRLLALEITESGSPDWTPEEIDKLTQDQRQGGFFDQAPALSRAGLRKIPYDFHYRYECEVEGKAVEYRHKIVDWEAGALFWRCQRAYRGNWEPKFREQLETRFANLDLMFLMGTIHRFPDRWLIVSLIYPPKRPTASTDQGSLFDL